MKLGVARIEARRAEELRRMEAIVKVCSNRDWMNP